MKNWPVGFKPTSQGMKEVEKEVGVVWNSAQCAECVDLRVALRTLATRDYQLSCRVLDIEILQLENAGLKETILQYTRGITDFKELADD